MIEVPVYMYRIRQIVFTRNPRPPCLALGGGRAGDEEVHAEHVPACGLRVYRGTSFIRKRNPLGPYRRPMPRV